MKKRPGRIVAVVLSGFLIVIMGLFGVFLIKKDDIANYLIQTVNESVQGKIGFDDLAFSPFRSLPDISLRIDQVTFTDSISHQPFVNLDRLFVSIDVRKLIAGEVAVSRVDLENGNVSLAIDSVGILNIERAVRMISTVTDAVDPVNESQPDISIDLKNINIVNVNFDLEDVRSGFGIDLLIQNLGAELLYATDSLDILADMEFLLNSLSLNDRKYLKNKALKLSTGFLYDQHHQSISVQNGKIRLENLNFTLDGYYQLQKEYIDLGFGITDNTFELLSIIVDDQLLDVNRDIVDEGSIFFNGKIIGSTHKQIPNFTFDFGAQDIRIVKPGGEELVTDFDFDGHFETGNTPDLSNASIRLAKLAIEAPTGSTKASMEISNFVEPRIIFEAHGNADLGVVYNVFRPSAISFLSGQASFDVDIEVDFPSGKTMQLKRQDAAVHLSNGAVNYKGYQIHDLNASLSKKDSLIIIDSLHVRERSNDLQVQGSLNGLLGYLFGKQPMTANLRVESDYSELDSLYGDVGVFEHTTGNVLAHVGEDKLEIQLDKMTSMTPYAHVEQLNGAVSLSRDSILLVDVDQVHAVTSKGTLDVTGTAVISDQILMDAKEFNIYSRYGNVALTGTFKYDSLSLQTNLAGSTQDLWIDNLRRMVTDQPQLHDSLRSKLHSTFALQARFNQADAVDGTANINGDFWLEHPELDTISIENLSLKMDSLTLSGEMNTLNSIDKLKASISMDHINTRYFKERGAAASVGKNGKEIVLALRSQTVSYGLTDVAELQITLDHTPKFALTYHVDDINLGAFTVVEGDTLVQGVIDFEFNAMSAGRDIQSIRELAEGNILITGEDVRIYGFNLDKILTNYKKSQNFRLTDVGAFMLMGPLGPLVTKGADFARIAKINPEDSTIIQKFYSNWQIRNQVMTTRDVAFSTDKSRIAFNGSLDLNNLTIPGIDVYVLDRRGCSLMSQSVSGSFAEPELGDLNVVGTLFGAVINVFKLAAGNQCKPVYSGIVEHPAK